MNCTVGTLVEQPSTKLFSDLYWGALNFRGEDLGENSLFGRENRGDLVLVNKLQTAFRKTQSGHT